MEKSGLSPAAKAGIACGALWIPLGALLIASLSLPGILAFAGFGLLTALLLILWLPARVPEKMRRDSLLISGIDMEALMVLLTAGGIFAHTALGHRDAKNWMPLFKAPGIPAVFLLILLIFSVIRLENDRRFIALFRLLAVYASLGLLMQFIKGAGLSYYLLLGLLGVLFYCLYLVRREGRPWHPTVLFLSAGGALTLFYLFAGRCMNAFVTDFSYLNWYLNARLLPWYAVLPLILLFMSVGAYFHSREDRAEWALSPDALLFWGLAGLLATVKATASFYFRFSWVMLLPYFLLLRYCAALAPKKRAFPPVVDMLCRRLHLNPPVVVLVGGTAALVLFCALLHLGHFAAASLAVWGMLIVLLAFWSSGGKNLGSHMWQGLLLAIGTAFFAFAVLRNLPARAEVLIAASYIFSATVMAAVHAPAFLPRERHPVFKQAVCVSLALICLLAVSGYGGRVSFGLAGNSGKGPGSVVVQNSSLRLTIAPRSKSGKTGRVSYAWNGGTPVELPRTGPKAIPVKRGRLTVTVTDARGAKSVASRWYLPAKGGYRPDGKPVFSSPADSLPAYPDI